MISRTVRTATGGAKRPQATRAAAITLAAIMLFVATGGAALGAGDGRSTGLGVAVCLNVALILMGWSRHRALLCQVETLTAADRRTQQLAVRDALTGLLNRRGLASAGAELMEHAQSRRRGVTLILLDLDRFKLVNDIHGHAVGDALLRDVAAEIESVLPSSAIVARLGGDEFACAFPCDPGERAAGDAIAQALASRLARDFAVEELMLGITASIGIAQTDARASSQAMTIDALLRAADIAMYAARKAGRNRRQWFDAAMELDLRTRTALENDLRGAIGAGQIVPFFEQQVDLSTGLLTGFEVLARWEHPTRGVIAPDQFIGIAEETALIGELSLCIMRQAFAAARDWDPTLTLSVNISPQQLRDPWLAQKIIKTLVETGFPASRTEIEITESSLFDNLPLAQSIIASLKNQGMRLALDDFGTGYSSLAHLRALPFDRIKIDKSFIQGMDCNPASEGIIDAIIRMGESLGMPTTAEGIESAVAADRLAAMGCARGQGYHYGRPIGQAGVRRLLAEHRRLAAPLGERQRRSG